MDSWNKSVYRLANLNTKCDWWFYGVNVDTGKIKIGSSVDQSGTLSKPGSDVWLDTTLIDILWVEL